jgi:hypothetical protein
MVVIAEPASDSEAEETAASETASARDQKLG